MKRLGLLCLFLATGGLASAQTPPSITGQSPSQLVVLASNVTVSVTASGTAPLRYQWQQNGANIPDATNSAYNIPFIQTTDLGSFTATVTNNYGSTNSTPIVLSASCAPVSSGLKAWWKAEGDATDAVGAYDSSAKTGVSYTPGVVGQCFTFDGSANAYVGLGTSVGNFGTNDFSVVFWEKVPTTNTYYPFVANDPPGGNWWEVAIGIYYPGLSFLISDSNYGTMILPATRNVADSNWHHIACTRRNAGGGNVVVSIYIDGTLDTNTITGIINPNQANYGLRLGNDQTQNRFLTGSMDEPALYSRCLSSDEIASIYAAGTNGYGLCCADMTLGTQPTSPQKIQTTSNAVFKVTANLGTSPFYYQWYHATNSTSTITLSDITNPWGSTIIGSTSTNLTIRGPLANNDLGTYTVMVWNNCNQITSQEAYLDFAPKFTTQTANVTASNGTASVTFGANFTGSNLSFQWRDNGVAINDGAKYAGTSTTNLTIFNIKGADADSYTVVASNHGGKATNSPPLVLSTPPQITADPGSQTVACGNTATFTPGVTGSTNKLSYRWQSNSIAHPTFADMGVTTKSLTLIDCEDPALDGTGYQVIITNQYSPGFSSGIVTSAVANLYIKPKISVQPAGGNICDGNAVNMCVTACPVDITYQWRRNGVAIPGATSSCFSTNGGGNYTVLVANAYGTITSSTATLADQGASATITLNPTSQTATVGNHLTLNAAATGTSNTLSWFKNTTNTVATGVTNLIFNNIQPSDAGSYVFEAANNCRAVDSPAAVLTVVPAACVSIPTNLVAWWQLEGDAVDYTGNYNGTAAGLTYPAGKVHLGAHFDGTTSSSLTTGTNAGNFGTNDFTVEFWVNTISTNIMAVMEKRGTCDACTPGWSIRIGRNNVGNYPGVIGFEIFAGGSWPVCTNYANVGTAVNDGLWHHVALVRSGVTASIYVDALMITNVTMDSVVNVDNSANFQMGRSICECCDGTQPLNGSLDEVAFYNRALSSSEIASIYNAASAGKCTGYVPTSCATNLLSGLLAWWKLEGNFNDYTGNNNGTASGVTYVTGEVNQGMYFDGSKTETNYCNTTVGNFGTNDFTAECWLNTFSTEDRMILMGKRSVCDVNPAGWDILIGYNNGQPYPGKIGFELFKPGPIVYGVVVQQMDINDGLWHHVALTRAGNVASMYIDGIMMTNVTMANTIDLTNTAPFKIGRTVCEGHDGTLPYNGTIDEVALYNRALSPAEIWAIYSASSLGKCSP